MVGTEGARTIEALLESVDHHGQGVVDTLVGVLLMVFGAAGLLVVSILWVYFFAQTSAILTE